MISWQQDWRKITGAPIKSPFTGAVLPAEQHPEPLYQQNLLPVAITAKLQHGLIVAPFAGLFTTQLDTERRLIIRHASGLRLLLELPANIIDLQGRGLHWLSSRQLQVNAGQPLLQLDLAFLELELELDALYCALVLDLPKPAESKVFCRQAKVNAAQDPLFIIQTSRTSA